MMRERWAALPFAALADARMGARTCAPLAFAWQPSCIRHASMRDGGAPLPRASARELRYYRARLPEGCAPLAHVRGHLRERCAHSRAQTHEASALLAHAHVLMLEMAKREVLAGFFMTVAVRIAQNQFRNSNYDF